MSEQDAGASSNAGSAIAVVLALSAQKGGRSSMTKTRLPSMRCERRNGIGQQKLTVNTTIFCPTCQGIKSKGGRKDAKQRADD